MSNTDYRRALVTAARHGAIPTRDILMAMDQMANARQTLETIQQNIERMQADSFMCRKQAD